MSSISEPQLAPPGAGLPKIELFVARLIFAVSRRVTDRGSHLATFQKERAAIHALVAGIDEEIGSRRVLIRRLPGLEDSSRYWSIWMTLDHLRIVNGEFNRILSALANGVLIEGEASTAAVKPDPAVTRSEVAVYENSCDELLATVGRIPDLRTRATFSHPWFGSLDAAGWWALAGTHLGIHRAQIERILAGMY